MHNTIYDNNQYIILSAIHNLFKEKILILKSVQKQRTIH